MPRFYTIPLRIISIACFAVTARADGGDDFANNLATDLAPLVALCGEQATKQYLSESTSMLDGFIIAMAPLGIPRQALKHTLAVRDTPCVVKWFNLVLDSPSPHAILEAKGILTYYQDYKSPKTNFTAFDHCWPVRP